MMWIGQWVDFKNQDSRIMFTIENEERLPVGGINLNSIDRKNGTFSLGYRIYRPHRNRGYGKEAAAIALRYAFAEMRLHKRNCSCVAGNEPSIRLLKGLGFREEGCRRQTVYMNGSYYDEISGKAANEHDAPRPLAGE